jgi:prepilin-type N-terminal cleavage/methylation domain-containing protein/prepilin-type processing-associated H-X9-DG protein
MKARRPSFFLNRMVRWRGAFTLTELLVVIAIVGVLVFLRLSALAGAKDQTKIAQCASNLRQLALTLHIYGNENADKLPAGLSGFWIWDLDGRAANVMFGGPDFQKFCYCPGTSFRFDDTDNFRLWWWASGGVPSTNIPLPRVIGYALALNNYPLIATNANTSLQPQSVSFGPSIIPAQLPSQRVLVADATISLQSRHDYNQRYTYEYVNITGGSYPKPHISPHLKGKLPVGGNLGMLDGHVEWRKFENMTIRGYGGVGGANDNGTCPTFWW